MSKRLDETIGAVGFDNLINGQYPPAEVFTVKIRKETTEAKIYKRGTVLALSAGTAGDGLRVILGTTLRFTVTEVIPASLLCQQVTFKLPATTPL